MKLHQAIYLAIRLLHSTARQEISTPTANIISKLLCLKPGHWFAFQSLSFLPYWPSHKFCFCTCLRVRKTLESALTPFHTYTHLISVGKSGEFCFQNISYIKPLFHTSTSHTLGKGVVCQDDLSPGLYYWCLHWSFYSFIHLQSMIYTISRIILSKHKSKRVALFAKILCLLLHNKFISAFKTFCAFLYSVRELYI